MRIATTDGLELDATVTGQGRAPVLLCVHGYPDDKSLWEPVAQRLDDRYRVVRYDVRGTGGSDVPVNRDGYSLDRLAADLTAVADAVSPDAPVHLLAHDWGSIQTWHAVTEPRIGERFATFTSISGPCLDHVGFWMRETWRGKGMRGVRAGLRQLARSWYIAYFRLPWLPELGWRSGLATDVLGRLERGAPTPAPGDAVHGLELYRANIAARMRHPVPRTTTVPVQVLAPQQDAFVTTPMQAAAARWAPRFTLRRVGGGHWLPRTDPDVVADAVTRFVEAGFVEERFVEEWLDVRSR